MDAPFGFGAIPRPQDRRDYRLGFAASRSRVTGQLVDEASAERIALPLAVAM